MGIAIGAGIAAGLLLAVGLPLFLGELIFGSIGWGLLHGLLLLAGIGVATVVIAFGVGAGTVGRSMVVGFATAVLVGVVLGLNITNRAWGAVGDALLPLSDPGARALAAAMVVLPVAFGVLFGLLFLLTGAQDGESGSPEVGARVPIAAPTGLYVGWLAAFVYSYSSRVAWPDLSILGVGLAAFAVTVVILVALGIWRPGSAFATGLTIGIGTGVGLGALTALAFEPRVAAGIGVTVGLVTWLGMMGAEVARRGVDTEELMKRFIPQKTMDITKETIEWARARMPLSRRS